MDAKFEAVSGIQHELEAGAKVSLHVIPTPLAVNLNCVSSQLDDANAFTVLDTLDVCLRASSQRVSVATLATLPTFFPLLTAEATDSTTAPVNVIVLRHVLNAFLSAGRLVDRLGDSRERVCEKARESLVVLAGLCMRFSSSSFHMSGRGKESGKEPPLAIWERALRDGALQSKVWRVQKQVGQAD